MCSEMKSTNIVNTISSPLIQYICLQLPRSEILTQRVSRIMFNKRNLYIHTLTILDT